MKCVLWVLVAGILIGVLVSCSNPMWGGGGSPTPTPPAPPNQDNDIANWFEDIYLDLLDRERNGTMGQVATCQYGCNVINAKWNKNVQPVAGTANNAANVKYLLDMIDNHVNNGISSYGPTLLATKQILDTTAVDLAVKRLGTNIVMYNAGAPPARIAYSDGTGVWRNASFPASVSYFGSNLPSPSKSVYGNGIYLLCAEDTASDDRLLFSYDGITWAYSNFPTRLNNARTAINDLLYVNGTFLALVLIGSSNNSFLSQSTNGVNWNNIGYIPNSIAQDRPVRLFYVNGRYFAHNIYATSSGNVVMYSSYDGINWTKSPAVALRSNRNPNSTLVFGNGRYIFSGNYDLVYSDDGVNWQLLLNNTGSAFLRKVVFGNGIFVGSTEGVSLGKTGYSLDGLNWTMVPNSITFSSNLITFANGMFITPGNSQQASSYSYNGINWITGTPNGCPCSDGVWQRQIHYRYSCRNEL